VDVEFRTREESSVDPPSPDYLRVQAAFAKVVYPSGAAFRMQFAVDELEDEEDFATKVWSKLVLL